MAEYYALPPLSLFHAHILAGISAGSYVGSLYVSQNTRITYSTRSPGEQARERERRRDDPDVIRARLAAVSLSTVVSWIVLVVLLRNLHPYEAWSSVIVSALDRLGLVCSTRTILSCLTAPVLYLGPLYAAFLSEILPLQKRWSFGPSVLSHFNNWIGWRNYIIAPITEEAVFRASILAVYHLAGVSSTKLVFLSPLWFGVAHLHHGVEIYYRLGCTRLAAQRAVISVVFQLAYTTLFGFHCAYLFLKTGSLLPPVASHMFCNFMGLPGFWSDVQRHPQKRSLIITAYVIGMAGYIYTLRAWTSGIDSLYWSYIRVN